MFVRRGFVLGLVLVGIAAVAAASTVSAQGPKPGTSRREIVLDLGFSHDGSRLAMSGDRVRVFEVESGKLLGEFESKLTRSVAFWPKDRDVLTACGDGGFVRLFRVGQPDAVREFKGHNGNVGSLAFDPSGERFVTGSVQFREGQAALGQLRLWDVTTGNELQSIEVKESGITGVSFSHDGALIAFCAGSQVHVQRVHG